MKIGFLPIRPFPLPFAAQKNRISVLQVFVFTGELHWKCWLRANSTPSIISSLSAAAANCAWRAWCNWLARGQMIFQINRDKLLASRGKKGLFGKKALASAVRAHFKSEHELSEVNFFERAVAAQGAGERWFVEKEKAMISNYERRGFMRDGEPASRGIELVRLYTEETAEMIKQLPAAAPSRKRSTSSTGTPSGFSCDTRSKTTIPTHSKRSARSLPPSSSRSSIVPRSSANSATTRSTSSRCSKNGSQKKRALKPPKENGKEPEQQ